VWLLLQAAIVRQPFLTLPRYIEYGSRPIHHLAQ